MSEGKPKSPVTRLATWTRKTRSCMARHAMALNLPIAVTLHLSTKRGTYGAPLDSGRERTCWDPAAIYECHLRPGHPIGVARLARSRGNQVQKSARVPGVARGWRLARHVHRRKRQSDQRDHFRLIGCGRSISGGTHAWEARNRLAAARASYPQRAVRTSARMAAVRDIQRPCGLHRIRLQYANGDLHDRTDVSDTVRRSRAVQASAMAAAADRPSHHQCGAPAIENARANAADQPGRRVRGRRDPRAACRRPLSTRRVPEMWG